MRPPYPKQGEPVPPDVGRGDWIAEGLVFLSAEPEGERVGPVLPIGLPAADIARAMDMTVDEVMLANREKRLLLSNKAVPPRAGVGRAMRFRVTIGDRQWEGTVGIEQLL